MIYATGPAVGVMRSRDGGVTWQTITRSDGQSFLGRILVDPEDPQRVLAADAARGPVASDDGGRSWRVLTTLPVRWLSATGGTEMIYASGAEGAVTSSDGGVSWEPLNQPFDGSLIEADPHASGRLYAGLHDGAAVTVFVSDDRGRSWRQA